VSDAPLDVIEWQMRAVAEDIGVDAVKTGMLSSSPIISLIAGLLQSYRMDRLVVDPVMVSTGGDRLIQEEAVAALKSRLFPLALLVTPNLREAEILAGRSIADRRDTEEAARAIHALGPRAVVIKGGHWAELAQSEDLFFDGVEFASFSAPRVQTRNTHGSGCTFAAAVTAGLARGLELIEAVSQAKAYTTEAIRHSYPLGRGHGPLGHFYRLWNRSA
jgi:hydroxymethylpyrimidine/phosphomethylpyrimidine kinase